MNLAIQELGQPPSALMQILALDRRAVEDSLESIAARLDGRLSQVASRTIRSGGKRVRPLLSCAILRALDHDPLPHMELISCVETIHVASLLHDDVVDGAQTRRGKVAAHIHFDSRTAVMAGDLLLATSIEILAQASSNSLVQIAARATSSMARGQAMEAEHAFETAVPRERLMKVNRLKTAALFAYAAESAAILANASPVLGRAAARYGELIGEAFQLMDDVLDWAGRQGVTGKRPGRDLEEGKVTMPLFLAMRDDATLAQAVRRYWSSRDHDERKARRQVILRRTASSSALEEARRHACRIAMSAAAELERLPPSPWRDELERLAARSVDRVS